MGGTASADLVPFDWGEIDAVKRKPATEAPSPRSNHQLASLPNVKVWSVPVEKTTPGSCKPFSSKPKALPAVKAVSLLPKDMSPVALSPTMAYIVLVLKPKDVCVKAGGSPDFRDTSLSKISRVMNEVCTPRGLDKPNSLRLPAGLKPPGSVEASVYVFTGRSASGMVKATALLRGMQLERKVLEHPALAASLLWLRREDEKGLVTTGFAAATHHGICSPKSTGYGRPAPHVVLALSRSDQFGGFSTTEPQLAQKLAKLTPDKRGRDPAPDESKGLRQAVLQSSFGRDDPAAAAPLSPMAGGCSVTSSASAGLVSSLAGGESASLNTTSPQVGGGQAPTLKVAFSPGTWSAVSPTRTRGAAHTLGLPDDEEVDASKRTTKCVSDAPAVHSQTDSDPSTTPQGSRSVHVDPLEDSGREASYSDDDSRKSDEPQRAGGAAAAAVPRVNLLQPDYRPVSQRNLPTTCIDETEEEMFIVRKQRLEAWSGTPVSQPLSPTHPDAEELDEKVAERRAREKLKIWAPLCSEVTPFLCVGGQTPAENLETLLLAGITHVLNTVEMIVDCCFPDHFTYLSVEMRDTINEDIAAYFPHVVAYVERVRSKPRGKLFLHCQMGSSRSCTLIVAYLMWLNQSGLTENLEALRCRRGIAKPNIGFLTRLGLWEKRLLSPPPVQVFRLQPFSSVTIAPLVLAYDDVSKSKAFDSRTAYFICDARGPPAAYLWQGSQCPDALFRHAVRLAPEILDYAYIPLPDGKSLWETVDCQAQAEGEESERLRELFQSHLGLEPPGELPAYNDLFSDLDELCREGDAHHARYAASELQEAKRAQLRARDVMALRGGAAKIKGATPRLRSQKVEAIDMFIYNGDYPPKSPGHYRSLPPKKREGLFVKQTDVLQVAADQVSVSFDEDAFNDFRDAYGDDTCLFIKHKADQKIVDVWSGIDVDFRGDDETSSDAEILDRIAQKLVAIFRIWTETAAAPSWTREITWNATVVSYTVDDLDEEKDLRFYARWVSD